MKKKEGERTLSLKLSFAFFILQRFRCVCNKTAKNNNSQLVAITTVVMLFVMCVYRYT